MNQLIIISAPSGAGKTTILKQVLNNNPQLAFSISACTREPRPGEVHGKDYYFIPVDSFQQLIDHNAFLEWEMVYPGKYYGTLIKEIERINQENKFPIVDIDVKGALNVKKNFPDRSISIFIKPPSLEVLKERLTLRGTETEELIKERIERAQFELLFEDKFDYVVVNDNLNAAVLQVEEIIRNFINKK